MQDNPDKKLVNKFNLPGYIKASEVDTFGKRLEELGESCDIYLFRIRNKQKVIEAAKGVKPLSPEGRQTLEIDVNTARTRIKKNVGNYGCYAKPTGICFIDFDLDANNPGSLVVPREKLAEFIQSQNTFTVISRSGGYQLYFKNPGLTENPHIYYVENEADPNQPVRDAGEFRCNNQYVVCPGSYVNPEGPKGYTDDANGVYRVIWDVPIKEFDPSTLPSWLKISSPAKVRAKGAKPSGYLPVSIDINTKIKLIPDDQLYNAHGESLASIRMSSPNLDRLLSGSEELGRSKSCSEADWAAILSLLKNKFTDQQVFEILLTHRMREKLLRPDYLQTSISRAKYYVVETDKQLEKEPEPQAPVESGPGRTVVEVLPEEFPLHGITQVNGLARIGKTSWAIKQLIKYGNGLYISTTHSIIENAMQINSELLSKMEIKNKTRCLVVGKHYACNDDIRKGHCEGCPKAPKNPTDTEKAGIPITDMDKIARELLLEFGELTVNNIPSEYCPYHILMHAHQFADFKFLVPFFSTVDDDVRKVQGRGLVVIDEGPTCDHYRTPIVQFATYQAFLQGGMVTPAFGDKFEMKLYKLREYIHHRLDDENGNKTTRKAPAFDSAILKIIEKIFLAQNILMQFNLYPTIKQKYTTEKQLKAIDFSNTYPEKFKAQILSKVEEYSKEASCTDENIIDIFTISLYPSENPFSWQGDSPAKLFFTSDNSLYRLPEGDKFLFVGTSQSKKFIDAFAKIRGITDVHEIYCNGFPFPNNYTFVRLAGPSIEEINYQKQKDPSYEPDIEEDQTKQLNKMYYYNSKYNKTHRSKMPAFVIVASKDKQHEVKGRLKGAASEITDEDLDGITNLQIAGKMLIIPQNSTVSRGIDIPSFDLVYFNPGGFATPSQQARIQLLIEKRNDTEDTDSIDFEIESLKEEIAEIQTDEITNNVLRTAPVFGDPSIMRMKVVVMREKDYQKLDYRIKNLTRSRIVHNQEDLKTLFSAISETQHKFTPVDAFPDRPYPVRSKYLPPITSLEPLVSLDAMHEKISNFTDLAVSTIDRKKISYQKIVNQIARIANLIVPNKLGKYGRLSKYAIINNITKINGTHITADIVEDCISCAIADRILIRKLTDGKILYSLHPNAIVYMTTGFPSTGPSAPKSYDVLYPIKSK